MHEAARLPRARDADPKRYESCYGLDVDLLASLLIAVIVKAIFIIPEHLIDQHRQAFCVLGIFLFVCRISESARNHRHCLQLPNEIAGQIDPLILQGADFAGSGDLIVHAAGIGAVPHRQTIMVCIIFKPSVYVLLQPGVVVSAEPIVTTAVLFRREHHQLGHERFEHLSRLGVADTDGTRDEAVRLLAIEKDL